MTAHIRIATGVGKWPRVASHQGELRQWIAAFLRSAQVPEEEAQLIAAVRLEAALRDPLGFDAFAGA